MNTDPYHIIPIYLSLGIVSCVVIGILWMIFPDRTSDYNKAFKQAINIFKNKIND
jgi:hypothetical protein